MKPEENGMGFIQIVMILVVIAIISALAAPKFSKLTARSVDANTLASIGAFKTTLIRTQIQFGNGYPHWADIEANLRGFDTETFPGVVTFGLGSAISGYRTANCSESVSNETGEPVKSWKDETVEPPTCYNL